MFNQKYYGTKLTFVQGTQQFLVDRNTQADTYHTHCFDWQHRQNCRKSLQGMVSNHAHPYSNTQQGKALQPAVVRCYDPCRRILGYRRCILQLTYYCTSLLHKVSVVHQWLGICILPGIQCNSGQQNQDCRSPQGRVQGGLKYSDRMTQQGIPHKPTKKRNKVTT